MKYYIEQECMPTLGRHSRTVIPSEVAVFENGDRVEIDWVCTMPKGKTLKDVMTLGRKES